MDSTTRQLLQAGIFTPSPVYQLKPVQGSSKILLDFNTCLCYYYALHTSIYT